MGRQNRVGLRAQRVVHGQRFGLEDVEGGSGQMAAVERVQEGVLIDESSS